MIIAIQAVNIYGIPLTNFQGQYKQKQIKAFQELDSLASVKKAELLHWLKERRGNAELISESEPLKRQIIALRSLVHQQLKSNATPEALRSAMLKAESYHLLYQHLSRVKTTYRMYHSILLADPRSGIVMVGSDENSIGKDITHAPAFMVATTPGHDEVIDIQKDSDNGFSLFIARPIKVLSDSGEEVVAVLVMNINPDDFIRPMLNTGPGLEKTGEVLLVNQDGYPLISPKYQLRNGTAVRPLETRLDDRVTSIAAEGGEGAFAGTGYQGVPVLAAYRHIRIAPGQGWGMVIQGNQSEFYADAQQAIAYTFATGLTGCLLVLAATALLASRLSLPIRKLRIAAQQVEAGDLYARAQVSGTDEIGQLAASFNDMASRIQEWHEEFEAQVEHRTAQLHDANESLQKEIEDRKKAEVRVIESESLLRNVLDHLPVGVWVADKTGKIIYGNPAGVAIWGGSRNVGIDEYGLYKGWWADTGAIIKPEEWACARAIIKGERSIGEVIDIEAFDGTKKTILSSALPIYTADGDLKGAIVVNEDITERKKAEEAKACLESQIRESQKMEVVGQLAGGIAHDFNNILTVIIGNGSLLEARLTAGSQELSCVRQILVSSQKAARLTHNLLAFSRKQGLVLRPVDLNEIITENSKILPRLIGEDIELKTELSNGRLIIMADQGQIEQIILNLATNARDAMPSGGTLTLATTEGTLDGPHSLPHSQGTTVTYACLRVSDTGHGFDESTREKIFEPFFTTKEVGKGTGLGLSIVYGIVKRHNGFINVMSTLRHGTTFTIYLPLITDAMRYEKKESEARVPKTGAETILIAEDDYEVRSLIRTVLAGKGYTVIEAADGKEAIEKFIEKKDSVRLVISDLIMPKMNGREACSEIKRIKPDIKIIFISGYTADTLSGKGLWEEETPLVTKPVAPSELLLKVREVLDN